MPQIKLLEADGTVAETLSITKWDTDTIEEFLQTYLIVPEEQSEDDQEEDNSSPEDRRNNEL